MAHAAEPHGGLRQYGDGADPPQRDESGIELEGDGPGDEHPQSRPHPLVLEPAREAS